MEVTQAELERWGRAIGAGIQGPVVLCLRGELGAGKSVLARSIARGAGVRGTLPSPTFNLLFRYPGRRGAEVIHMDLYRLGDPEELWELGWEELGQAGEIILVEWPERAGGHLPPDRWEITLTADRADPLVRRVQVRRVGNPPDLPPFPLSVDGPQAGGAG